MAKGYWIVRVTVKDKQGYPDYLTAARPAFEKFGAQFLVRGGRSEAHEGTPPGDRNVIIRFPSFEKAREWNPAPDYAEAKALRMSASSSVQTIVEGVA